MAGSTTNIGLKKPTYSEDADVAIINENMDALDSTISALDNGLAIVSNNNTHGAITAGQYVYVRNHESLAEGMYTANSNIAANATLSSSNLTAVSSGSLNKLNSDITTLNGGLAELNGNLGSPSSASSVTGADAFSKINTLNSKIGLQSGTNNIGGVICAGYNTGSGNYCDAFIPINTNGNTVTSVSADNSSCIFLGTSRIDFTSAPTISVLGQTDFGVRVEISYPSTKTSNVCATVYLVALKIVCS